ncbi:hypothetical protein [uncultured Methanobacterium sp.]|uniref:hypothetical protein n=1 Tax=uncultured Methanobacterium sp. TaxID=176306 RepID=UPI002AA90CA9|nr:hypothetical protein [uncultured Methanobacterium sp.]
MGGNDDKNEEAYSLMKKMATGIILILIVGIGLAFYLKNFAIVPFSVVIMGIITFFGMLRISRALTGTNENEIRKSITVSIMVVYLGLLPTLAFQGILQFQFTGNITSGTEVSLLNQTVNQTVIQVIPQTVSLSETVVTSFTALVAAVLLFYFGAGSLDKYTAAIKDASSTSTVAAATSSHDSKDDSVTDNTVTSNPTKFEKEVTVAKYDKDGKYLGKTVTTEKVKKIIETCVIEEHNTKRDND